MNKNKNKSKNKNKNKKTKSALAALTASALSIPSLHTQAATAPVDNVISYRNSVYSEDDAKSSDVATGSTKRYDIDIQQFKLIAPVGKNFAVRFDALTEKMSGASPMGTQAGSNGVPQLVMSGASIVEDREDFTAAVTHYGETMATGFSFGQSSENDYKATYFGLDWEWEFNKKNSAIQIAYSQSNDDITPFEAILFGRIQSASKKTQSFNLGYSKVLNKISLIQFGLGLSEDTGYLSDPYKIDDARPTSRTRYTAIVRYRYFVKKSNGAVHFDYRYYSDDWNVNSHTFKLAWHKNITEKIQLVPSIRYYSQTEANFYEPYKVAANTNPYYSSDYRLSPYGTVSLGLQFIHKFKNFSYTAKVERYESSGKYSLTKVAVESPGLVNYTLLTVGFDFTF